MKYPFVCADVETTGLDPQVNEVIEITCIEFNLSGETGKRISRLCRPISGHIPKHITDINHITWDMVKGEKSYLTDGINIEVSDFIGARTLVGHNIKKFDIPFMRIKTERVYDTLEMCREKYRGGNKLKTACQRVGLKWDNDKAHRAEYDVEMTIKLFVKLMAIEDKNNDSQISAPLFNAGDDNHTNKPKNDISVIDGVKSDKIVYGVIPSESDKELVVTQAYSYSRINLYHQCAFKWYMQYIKKVQQPDVDYLILGSLCHKIAEFAGVWCDTKQFMNKFEVYAKLINFKLDIEKVKGLAVYFNEQESKINFRHVGKYLYKNREYVKDFFDNIETFGGLLDSVDNTVDESMYEKVTKPDLKSYTAMINKAINDKKVNNPAIIGEVEKIMFRFYNENDFKTLHNEMSLYEKRMAFDRDWVKINDFFSGKVFFRGIIDKLSYYDRIIVITDYKTSRKMLSQDQVANDHQMMVYITMSSFILPRESYDSVVVRIHYLRYSKTVEVEFSREQIDVIVNKTISWIESSVQDIEQEMLKTDGTAFPATRNEFCHSCYLGEDGKCPLFDKRLINNIDDPYNFIVNDIEDCQAAWKRVEVNKSEISRLSKQCKEFVKSCEIPVVIDDKAILDFHTKETSKFITENAVKFLLKKGVDIEYILKYMSFPESGFNKLVAKKHIDISKEDMSKICVKGIKSQFDALTEEEKKSGGFIN